MTPPVRITAAKVEQFITRHLRLTEGPWAGEPFKLFPYQREVIRDIYDDRRPDGRRRIEQYYLEAPKGNGKSPFLAALGVVELLTSGPGALVFSTAATFAQANETTFRVARDLILNSPTLAPLCEVQERQIKGPDGCRWLVMTADARKGKAGYRPTCAILDELQEQPDRRLLDTIEANQRKLGKRQPLLLLAGNAGTPDCVAASWNAKARRFMAGERGGDLETFGGRAYGLEPEEDWREKSRWSQVNPAINEIITLDALEKEYQKALTDPGTEYRFRTLHLGQWVRQAVTGFLDMDAWARCSRPLPPVEQLRKWPCWIGFDLSLMDDLSAVATVWVDPDTRHIYATVRHWLPRPTAERYETEDSIPYTAWERAGEVVLTDTATVDHTVRVQIAEFIEQQAETFQVEQVCYDQRYAPELVGRLEAAGLTCEPISPKFDGVSAPTKALASRLVAGTMTVEPSACLSWQARNLHVTTGNMGDVRPVKHAAKGRYAGRVALKIDGIVSTILAMARACRAADRMAEATQDAKIGALYL